MVINENRGKIDIGWTISPALSEAGPDSNAKDISNGVIK